MKFISKFTSQDIGKIVMGRCLNVQPKEKVLIVTDTSKLKVEAAIFFETAKKFTDSVTLVLFDGMTGNAQEPPAEIQNAMFNADVGLLITTYSLSHTKTRLEACRRGGRIVSMPGITEDIILRSLNIDYESVANISRRVARTLSKGSRAKLMSPAGTNLDMFIEKRQGIADIGIFKNPGDFGNLPAGEAFIAPQENMTNGTVVFDGALANIELDKPISVQIRKGVIQKIMGGKAATIFEQAINAVGSQARIVCELGVGTNPAARLSPQILEAEKVYGTCHIAFGKNNTFGGIVDVPFHTDGLIKNPTLIIDDVTVIKKGKFGQKFF